MTGPFLAAALLAAAYCGDLVLGDPQGLPHPVRGIGWAIAALEKLFLRPGMGAAGQKAAGAAVVLLVAGGTCCCAFFPAALLAARWGAIPAAIFSAVLIYTALSVRDLIGHVKRVEAPLLAGDLEGARRQVSRLVSRDTAGLDESGIARAALESLFENTADGVAAPLFYASLGGAPLALCYKAVNTLDSMLGYRDRRYLHFGWAAARTDDLFGFIPSRLTAGALLLAGALRGLPWKRGLAVLRTDRRRHASPNSAWPEAAAAGLLGLRLGGAADYAGQKTERPRINRAGRPPRAGDLRPALALFRTAALVLLGLALVLTVGISLLGEVW